MGRAAVIARPAPAPHGTPVGAHASDASGASDAYAPLAAFGDAVAVFDPRTGRLAWVSDAWRAMQPTLAESSTFGALRETLAGLPDLEPASLPQRCRVGPRRQWCVQAATLDDGTIALRLTDRREQGRALQRQLDDREQLLFTSRVLSVGEMAATLAHELNQPIGTAANLLRGLRMRLARRPGTLEPDEAAALDGALEQVMFGARIIARIREFTHAHQPRPVRLDLVALLRDSAALLDWDVQRNGARLSLALPDGEVPIRGDATMLQQVVVNLIRNALDALRADPPEDPRVELALAVGARSVEIRVGDNGCGIDEAGAARLFVPFASSKPNGTGIGLLICRSFVEQHQGRLWFSRNAGRGVTFHISVPRHPE